MQNKKGIEMSINVIVSLILGLMLFGAGMYLFITVINQGHEIQFQMSAALEEQIRRNIANDNPVYASPLKIVADKDVTGFGVGIKNVYPSGTETFRLQIEAIDDPTINEYIVYLGEDDLLYDLAAREVKIIPVQLNTKYFPSGNTDLRVEVTLPDGSTYYRKSVVTIVK